jgi:hypothetical protein
MCNTATKTNNQFGFQSGVQSTKLPAWATDAGQQIATTAGNWSASNPYQAYSGPTAAQFGNQWDTAGDYATTRLGQTNPEVNSSNQTLDKVLGISGETAGESMSALMSPYTDNVLQPTLRKIGEAAQNQNNATAAEAQMSGAFGDSGFGLERSLNARNTQQNIGDATGAAYDRAFNNAVATKNNALSNLLQVASGKAANGNAENANNNTLLQVLQSMGSTEESRNLQKIITDMAVNSEQNNGALNRQASLQAILRGAPMDTTTSSVGNSINYGTQTQPDNTMEEVGGNLLGKALFGGGGGGGTGSSALKS